VSASDTACSPGGIGEVTRGAAGWGVPWSDCLPWPGCPARDSPRAESVGLGSRASPVHGWERRDHHAAEEGVDLPAAFALQLRKPGGRAGPGLACRRCPR